MGAVAFRAEEEAPCPLPVVVSSRVEYPNPGAITIDDEDTREVDDALTVSRSGNELVVGIHIADVSAFIHKGDLLDAEARRRSSTIYLPAVSVRMFPERLSTDLSSLNAGVPRAAFTVEVRFDEQGNRLGYRIALTTVQVQRRLSYDEADAALEGGDSALQLLHGIAKQLHDAGLRNLYFLSLDKGGLEPTAQRPKMARYYAEAGLTFVRGFVLPDTPATPV